MSDVTWSEAERLDALRRYGILDTPAEAPFDDAVALVKAFCRTPVALVSLVDADRQWFKAKVGTDVCETAIDTSVCALAIRQPDVFVIPDLSTDPRTARMSLVVDDPRIRFYAGVPLVTSEGFPLGSLCAIDVVPRPEGLTDEQRAALVVLGRQVVSQIELRTAIDARDRALADQERRQAQATQDSSVLQTMLRAQQRALHGGGDLDAVLQALVDAALDAVETADGVIVEVREGDDLVYRAAAGASADRVGFRIAIEGSFSGLCLEQQSTLITEDAARDERVNRDTARILGIGSMVVVPLSRYGEAFGVLKLRAAGANAFNSRHILIGQMLGGLISASFTESAEQAAIRETKRSQEDYRGIVESAVDTAIISTDVDGLITSWNRGAEKVLGWSSDDMLGEPLATIFTPEDNAIGRPAREMAVARETGSASDERWHMRRDGERFFAVGQVTPLLGDGDRVDGFVKVLRDRTDQRLATESLRSSQANIRMLLDSMVEGFYAVDREGVTTICNQAFLDMMGFASEEDAVGRRLHDVIHHSRPDGSHFDVADCPIYTCARTGTPAHVHAELFFPVDGRPPLPVEYWAIPILEDGELKGTICTFLDITERQAADDARSRSEARLRELNADLERQVVARSLDRGMTWQVSADLLAVVDSEGRYESTNPAWGRVLGWSEEELRRICYKDLVHPDDLASADAAFAQVARGDPVVRYENRHRRASGDYRWLSWVAVPENGKVYCRARDVTAERRQAEELRARTAERDRLWSNSQDLLAVIDTQGVFKDVSPVVTKILGWTPGEMIGCNVFDFIHADDFPSTRDALDVASAKELPSYVNRYRHKDGTYRWLSWVAAPDGDLIVATARHITAEREAQAALRTAEDALRQSQKVEAIGQLTGGVAHDFNNLLTVIRGSVDLLRRPELTTERRERYLNAIADTSDRAVKLTSQLLAFARRSSLKPETFDAGASILALREMIGTLAGSRVSVGIEVCDDDCFIDADPSQFDTAIVNMAVNARDAMIGEGDLSIVVSPATGIPAIRNHARVEGDFVLVSITDTGTGIAADQVEHIFEPFFTTKDVGQGTGLGLSQVFGFSKQSGGEIVVDSRVGEGTTFSLYLPRVARPVDRSAGIGTHDRSEIRGARILVVEDNREVGEFATQALAELGHVTVLAADAREALARLAAEPSSFDMVFSDVVMPGMTGIELGQEVRETYPRLPVLLTSGYSSVLADEGTHGFELLQKPYSVEELSAALGRMLHGGTDVDRVADVR